MMTGYGTSQTSIDAIREGAYDYLTKPLDLDELREVIRKAVASQQTSDSATASVRCRAAARARRRDSGDARRLQGDRPAGCHRRARARARRARHRQAARDCDDSRQQPAPRPAFVSIDCTAVPDAVLEAEWFERATGTLQLAGR